MPLLSRLFIKISLIYLGIGMLLGAILLANKGIAFMPELWQLLPVHVHLMVAGWLAQFAMGVGYWMFPRFGGGAHRGRTWLAGMAFASINLGLLVSVVGFSLTAVGLSLPTLPTSGGALEALGACLYALHAWPRIKPLESLPSADGR